MPKKNEALQKARRQGRVRYFTGTPCVRGHIAERFTSSARCVECAAEDRRGKLDYHRQKSAEWRVANTGTGSDSVSTG